ncbi:ABC transporter permease [Acidocella sp.]|uniref:ABC transporter permease n=1 Tax=Acidocella sp. TaxID=50710 RepID=UPI00260FD9E0|nr:ABC transporter permease [Acidocella sp.]
MSIPASVRYTLAGISWPVYVLLYTPLVLVAYYSLTPHAASEWHAYQLLFSDSAVFTALQRSLILALGSASSSTALGVLLGYGLARFRNRHGRGWLSHLPGLIIYTPIIMPSIVFGISELIFFNLVHNATGLFAAGLQTMMIAHITFQVPYVALTVFARLSGLDPNLFDAAHDLYADGVKSFIHLILPVVQPAIIGGFLLGITLSIDDFTISFFTAGPGSVTLPIYIYSAIARKGVTPEINALGTVMIGTIIIMALGHFFITSRRERAGHFAARGNLG